MKKILIAITSHIGDWTIPRKTGYWLGEITHFYNILSNAGFEIDLVSPLGGTPPLDIKSVEGIELFDSVNKKFMENKDFQNKLKNTFKPEEIKPEDYSVIYFAGGHGVMWDFPNNSTLVEISRNIYESNGIVSAVCHGSVGLLNIKLSNGKRLIEGKKVTGFSNLEEKLIGLTKLVPFLTEDALKENGGVYQKSILPFTPYAIMDERLVTGQNPYSSKKVGNLVLKILGEKK
ncbi:MAG: type 1 glutamine amidotransferase domain-containing protein [Leptospiraceae bacterium]|nr:type 1 glutamine amidotransferase domain-containing protein [Leptospiraceae bacterium]